MAVSIDPLLIAARQHMDRWRFAEALHHYRGAAAIHPYDPRGHIGAAQCLAAMNQLVTAITELTSVAREITKRGHHEAARALMAEALRLDPSQLELHVDLAELEIESGERVSGLARLHELAMAYFAARRIEEGRSVLDAIDALRAEPGAVHAMQTGHTEPMTVILKAPRVAPREETVIARTVLRFPDGTPMPAVAPIPGTVTKTTVTKSTVGPRPRARFRVPIAPRIKPPPQLRQPRR